MIPDDDKISSIQLGVFIYNIILGVGILSLPSSLAKDTESDAWVVAIIAGVINIFFVYLMCKVGVKYSRYGFVGTLRKLFGRVLGTILAIPTLIYFMVFTGIVVRIFGETVKLFMLINTPIEFVMLPLIILSVVLARSGVEPTSRFFEAVTPLIILVSVFLILIAIPNSDYTNILPIFSEPPSKYLAGIKDAFFAFAGFEILMVLFPFLRKPKEAFKASSIAIIFITILYTIVIIQCLAKFGIKETQALIYPTATLAKSSEIPGGFIERAEGLLLSLWVLYVFTTTVALMFAYSVIGADIMGHKKRKHIVSLLLPAVYIISLTGQSIAELFKIGDMLTIYLGVYIAVILPIIMFIASLIRRDGGEKNET